MGFVRLLGGRVVRLAVAGRVVLGGEGKVREAVVRGSVERIAASRDERVGRREEGGMMMMMWDIWIVA